MAVNSVPDDDRSLLESIVRQLETAWNAMDGAGFAAPFALDADFVNIVGEHHQGRPAIVAGHEAIFRTVYAGSTVALTLESARLLRPDVALVHVQSILSVPQGPMAGRRGACFSMILTRGGDRWEIASFHNTAKGQRPAPPT